MPIYEYKCDKCNETQSFYLSYSDSTIFKPLCDTCNKPMFKIIAAPAPPILKGDGWYKGSNNNE